jgi:endonuclease YncB( thermonuclease family)
MATAPRRRTKAIDVNGIFKTGQFLVGMHGAQHGTPRQEVHDGDTVGLSTPLDFSTRFLGIDAPEVSFTIRTEKTFVPIGDPKWQLFWTSGDWKNMPLDPSLLAHLSGRIGNGSNVAANHKSLADKARSELLQIVNDEMAATGKTKDEFTFFLAFAYEILDGYGRMLCYLNADRVNFVAPNAPNKLSYNERMLATGAVVPYFIFPNVQPFIRVKPFDSANLTPAGFWTMIAGSRRLRDARQAVAAARAAGSGVFHPTDGLIVLPYEIRFIARKDSKGPDRFVIDLGNSGGNAILKPESYFTIANLEDRLFIPKEFVPLFILNGWTVV